ncbi:hypothetical protein GTO91_08745 [Heliobacterium undosum]|uniref:Uncharacterized protein n=1 Tax=Heliomicrobium undosum TaxID=121734 RepID=A0A845L014_9FIRM|nr:hypothetical protein [Heliomicrobium undosum]MZP29792.1 hypothetical protein [Heliomicrobium undosum]
MLSIRKRTLLMSATLSMLLISNAWAATTHDGHGSHEAPAPAVTNGDGGAHGGTDHKGAAYEEQSVSKSDGKYQVLLPNSPAWTLDKAERVRFVVKSADDAPVALTAVTVQFVSQEGGHGHGESEKPAPVITARPVGNGEYEATVVPEKEGKAVLQFRIEGEKGDDVSLTSIDVKASPPHMWFLGAFGVFVVATLTASTLIRVKDKRKEAAEE